MMERARRISSHTAKIEHEAVSSFFAEALMPSCKCCSTMPKAWLAGDDWDFPAESLCHLTGTVPVPHPCCAPVPAKEHPVLSSALQTQVARSPLSGQASHHICAGHLHPFIQMCDPQQHSCTTLPRTLTVRHPALLLCSNPKC